MSHVVQARESVKVGYSDEWLLYRGADKSLADPTEKTIGRSPFFVRRGGHYCRGDLDGRTTFRIFFWVACKS